MAKKKEPLSAKQATALHKQSAKLSAVSAALEERPIEYSEACSLLDDREAHASFRTWYKAIGVYGEPCMQAAKAFIQEWKLLEKAAKIKGKAVNKELAQVEKLLK